MTFTIIITPSAQEDIKWFKASEQRMILNAIRLYLQSNADQESNRRKKLRTNNLAPWELKEGMYRVFYGIEEQNQVKIFAVGYKEHNQLYIRGGKAPL